MRVNATPVFLVGQCKALGYLLAKMVGCGEASPSRWTECLRRAFREINEKYSKSHLDL